MVRSQGYLADRGHLALLRMSGEVITTQPQDGQAHKDVNIGKIEGFDPAEFIAFDISIDESAWKVRIGSVEHATRICDLPYVFSEGRIIVEGQFCWVCLRTLEVSNVS